MKNQAFTLVELIVVITILAILSTIWFVSYSWFLWISRDSKRLYDIKSIENTMELNFLKTAEYPNPDDFQIASYNSTTLWKQWTFWDDALSFISKSMTELPIDPLYKTQYIYSVTSDNQRYELMFVTENKQKFAQLFDKVFANDIHVMIQWNYNKIAILWDNFIFPTPSIITSETLPAEINNWNINSQVVKWEKNVPDLSTNKITQTTNQLNINNFEVYNWNISKSSNSDIYLWVYDTILNSYSWSLLENTWLVWTLKDKQTDYEKISVIKSILFKSPISSNNIESWTTSPPIDTGNNYPVCSAGWSIPCTAN